MAGIPSKFKYILKELQTTELVNLGTYDPGTYEIEMTTEGNSLLSTLYVSQANGGSVLVEYFDYTTGRGEGQEYALQSHDIVSTDITTDKLTVTKVTNKPVARITISGAPMRLSLTVTVVSSFASDLDAALVRDAETFERNDDRGLPVAGIDETNGLLKFLRLDSSGRLLISGDLQLVSSKVNHVLSGAEISAISGISTLLIDYTVPVGKSFIWIDGLGHSDTIAAWTVEIDGLLIMRAGDTCTADDTRLKIQNTIELASGQNLKVYGTVRHPGGSNGSLYGFIYGNIY